MGAIHHAFASALHIISGDALRRAAMARFNDDDWYHLDERNRVVRVIDRSAYSPSEAAQAKLPAGHRMLCGMAAKYVATLDDQGEQDE